jgi:hypothetical protein
LNRLHVEAVLEGKEPFREGLLGVLGTDPKRRLKHDRPGVHPRVDEVHGDSGDGHLGFQSPALRKEPAKGREERRMHVEDRDSEAFDHVRAEKPHEPAQGHEIGAVLARHPQQLPLGVRMETRPGGHRSERQGRDAQRPRLREDRRVRTIAHDPRHLARDPAVPRGLDQVDRMGPPAGSQDEQPKLLH